MDDFQFQINDKILCTDTQNSPLSKSKVYHIVGFTAMNELILDGVRNSWRKQRFEKFYDEIDILMLKIGYKV